MYAQFMHSGSTTLNFPSILKCTHMGHCPILVCVNVYLSNLRAWTTLPIQIIWIKQSFELSSECQEPIGNKNTVNRKSQQHYLFLQKAVDSEMKQAKWRNQQSSIPFHLQGPEDGGSCGRTFPGRLCICRGDRWRPRRSRKPPTRSRDQTAKNRPCVLKLLDGMSTSKPKLWLASSHELKLESLINFRWQFTESTQHPCT